MEKNRTLASEVIEALKEMDAIINDFTKGDLNTFEALGALDELHKSPRLRLIRNLATSDVAKNKKDPSNISIVKKK